MSKKSTKKSTKKVKSTKRKDKVYNDSWMFAMLLSVTCILALTLNSYHFRIFNTSLSFSVFVIPVCLFVSNYITKEYGFSDSLKSIVISCLMLVAFSILIYDLTNQKLVVFDIILPFIIYFASLFINLVIYYYDLINFLEHKLLNYINYVFVYVIYYLFYLLYYHNYVITNNFWSEYFISIILSSVVAIPAIYIDSKIVRGIDIEKIKKQKRVNKSK